MFEMVVFAIVALTLFAVLGQRKAKAEMRAHVEAIQAADAEGASHAASAFLWTVIGLLIAAIWLLGMLGVASMVPPRPM